MVAKISSSLLPDNTTIHEDGMVAFAGIRADDLAKEYGTPLFVYDEAHIRQRCREAVQAFPDGVSYATKAFLCKAMARLAYEEGMGLDVATIGEAFVAIEAGVPAAKLTMHGNNKSYEELQYAMENGIGKIVIDSFDEIAKIEQLFSNGGSPIQALIRITPGVEAHTHEYISTGEEDSKFGFTVSTGLAEKAIDKASNLKAIELIGIHAHIGSQVFTQESFRKSTETLADLSNSFSLPELSVGGGLGVPYLNNETSISISEWGAIVGKVCEDRGVTARVTAEPGRSIVGSAAVTLYTVGTIKKLDGIRTYVAVDGGMHDNPRPALYGSGYETFLARSAASARQMPVTLVGKHCESEIGRAHV